MTKASEQRGFTLIEVMVALALAGVVFALATSSWLTLSGSQNRLKSGLIKLEETISHRAILTQILGQALPWHEMRNAQRQLMFQGDNDGVDLIAVRPAIEAGSAYLLWQLRSTTLSTGEGHAIEVHLTAYYRGDEIKEPRSDGHELMHGSTAPVFAYLAEDERGLRWLGKWQGDLALPLAIRVEFGDEPAIIVPLRLQMPAICASELAVEFEECA